MLNVGTLPYLRAIVQFLDHRLSQLLPAQRGSLEVVVEEVALPALEDGLLEQTWIEWISQNPSKIVGNIIRRNHDLEQVVKLIRFASWESDRRRNRGGQFATFAILFERGFLQQPWIRFPRAVIGDRWRDGVCDSGTGCISARRCWIEVNPFPDRLMTHLVGLVAEMEEIGEHTLLRELGLAEQHLDMRMIEASVRMESERLVALSTEPVRTEEPASLEGMPPHIAEFGALVAKGEKPKSAADIVNKKYGKDVTRKSYQDMYRSRHKKLGKPARVLPIGD